MSTNILAWMVASGLLDPPTQQPPGGYLSLLGQSTRREDLTGQEPTVALPGQDVEVTLEK